MVDDTDNVKVGLVGHTAAGNAVGRIYSNWLALTACGVESLILLPANEDLWPPIANDAEFVARVTSDPAHVGAWADVLVAHKPWPGSVDVALELAERFSRPVVVDVDDPDFENQFGETRFRNIRYAGSKLIHGHRVPIKFFRSRMSIKKAQCVTLSNPGLRRWYSGSFIVPHARAIPPESSVRESTAALEVCFVGTARQFKGIEQLRRAARSIDDVRLTVTADPPPDAAPEEQWVGETSLAEGIAIVSRADVVCIPTLPSIAGRGQLPAKLVDGMLAGRAILASDLPPIAWALGDSGVLVPAGDVTALAEGLDRLKDTTLRRELGEAAKQRGKSMFSPEVVGATLLSALAAAMGR